MVEIFNSLPAVGQNFQKFLPGTIEAFEHVISDFADSANGQQCILTGEFSDIFILFFQQSFHLHSKGVTFVDEYFVVHVGGCGLQAVNVLMGVIDCFRLIRLVLFAWHQGGGHRVLLHDLMHFDDGLD